MVTSAIVSVFAIAALAFVEWCLLEHGFDGTIAILVVASIAGLGGYNVQKILSFLKDKSK